MSSPADSRRRSRSELEGDDDADLIRRSQGSTPSSSDSAKRARTNGYRESPSIDASRQRRNNRYDDDDDDIEEDSDTGPGEFQPGAIVRVKLTNFVTYESAEFFPGPNLNMVIGPNGTGKSSLVCAICLGLGWGPQHLGRAQQIGEFVKHNTSVAEVEIELQRRSNEAKNHVVRLRISKENNGREFFLDNRKTALKSIQDLTKGFNIQVDNLCQFLPQDKVSEFAALSPVELLQQTQRAAAPPEMLEQHDKLKELRREQKRLDQQLEGDKENFGRMETRQEGLRAERERLEERQQIEETVKVLRKTVPFVEYRAARKQHAEFKKKKKEAQKCLEDLETELAPTLQSIEQKESYTRQIAAAARDRKTALENAEKDAGKLTNTIDTIDETIKEYHAKIDSERQEEQKRKKEFRDLERNISNMKARLNDPKIDFNGPEWNERMRAKQHEIRDVKSEIDNQTSEKDSLLEQGRTLRGKIQAAQQELAAFDTQEGQQSARLKQISPETATAWEWVQANQDKFEKEVYGPPLISCSIKDPRYTDAIESLLRHNDFLTITPQTDADFKKLQDQLLGTMGFAEMPIRKGDGSGLNERLSITAEEMQRFGLDGWALDFIDGPEAVLSMFASKKLNLAAVALRDASVEQLDAIEGHQQLSTFANLTRNYNISRRREYGPTAVSTRTSAVSPAKYWTDQPVDTSGKIEVQSRIDAMQIEFDGLKAQVQPIRREIEALAARTKELETELKQLAKDKAALQEAHGKQVALPSKIAREEETLQEKKEGFRERRDRIKALLVNIDNAALKKAQHALNYKDAISRMRTCHEELLEAEIRLIEAKSDVAGLTNRNQDIHRRLEEEREKSRAAETASARVHDIAKRALEVCQEIRSDPDNAKYLEKFTAVSPRETVERLETEIAAEEAKLEFVHASNPNAIRDFEARQLQLDKLKDKISDAEEKLESIERKITTVRGKWEPALDNLIAEISEAFSFNFEQIGCAGQVSVHKDEDFDLWAVEIKVKFRENEPLQKLDQHRQSGGERSVSTIFYLMSLQSLARAPFRVVDEINQGMDPRNERMVHERMVDIACKEHTSQYFLITPKLLTGLRYHKRMKVHCIASGEHMPADHRKLDISKILAIRRAMVAVG